MSHVIETSDDSVEIEVDMGGIKFTLDVGNAVLSSDSEGRETLDVRVGLRGIGSKGQALDSGLDRNLCVS